MKQKFIARENVNSKSSSTIVKICFFSSWKAHAKKIHTHVEIKLRNASLGARQLELKAVVALHLHLDALAKVSFSISALFSS